MKKKIEKSFLKKKYLTSLNYLIRSRWWIVFTLAIFSLTIIIGFTYPYLFRQEIFEFFKSLIGVFEGAGFFKTWWLIFFNNLKASLIAVVLGLGFGIVPLGVIIINGYLIGFTSRIVAELEGLSSLWRLLPHGIFELPAVILSVGFGIRLGFFVLKRDKHLKKEIKDTFTFFTYIVIPLLAVAALIETFLVIFFS